MSKRVEPDYRSLYSRDEEYRRERKLSHPDYFLQGSPFKVEVRDGDINKALRRFRSMTKKSNLKQIQIEGSFYKKPSEVRKDNLQQAQSRQRRKDKIRAQEERNLTDSGTLWS